MRRINLLPWREWQRQRALRRFKAALLVCALAGAVAVLIGDRLVRAEQARQQLASDALREDISALDQQLERLAQLTSQRDELAGQVNAIEALRADRQPLAEWLALLGRWVPYGVRLTGVQLLGAQLQVTGVARSGLEVAQLLEGLARLPGVAAPTLKEIKATPAGEQFQLTALVAAIAGEVGR